MPNAPPALQAFASVASSLLTLAACGGAPCHPEALAATAPACASAPCPPGPPDRGPGSLATPHADVVVTRTKRGVLNEHGYTTYEPTIPAPASAPVVLFLHGFFDAEPKGIDAMLRHLARRGFLVVYPTYGVPWAPGQWEENAAEALGDALQRTEASGRIKPDRQRVSFVGHSIGAPLALRLAQRATAHPEAHLPPPLAVVSLDGAGLATPLYSFLAIDDLSALPPSVWLLFVMAEETYAARRDDPSGCVGDEGKPPSACNGFAVARRAFARTPQIARDHKAAVVIPSDARGSTELRSDHNAVIEHCGDKARPITAIDTWGYWKLTAGALALATSGKEGEYAFGATPHVRAMGEWSDGKPVRAIYPIDACLLGEPCP